MPLKCKIYYACSLYLLIWSAWFFLYGCYETFAGNHSNGNIINELLALLLIALVIFKAVLSLKAVHHYKNNTSFSKSGRVIFIIGFSINVLVFVAVMLLCIFIIIPEFMQAGDRYYSPSFETQLIDISFVITGICSAYLCIFDLILLKAIRKKQAENFLSFELEANEPI